MAKRLKLKEAYNNAYDTDEILYLLKGHEHESALEFVCKSILNKRPEDFMDAFEYVED